jgi:hypothetical protein
LRTRPGASCKFVYTAPFERRVCAGRSIECGFLERLPKHEENAPLESRPASQVPKEEKE